MTHEQPVRLRRKEGRERGGGPYRGCRRKADSTARLLTTTEDKVETIAHACGYENPFVFSTTFKKWVGWRPSDYRARKR